MATWTNICQLMKYADTSSEINYQKSIKDMVLEVGLGWKPEQISEQASLALGSTDRLVPDIIVSKDNTNIFIVEMKEASHVKRDKDILQLASYMKQLETPVGVYIGNQIEVYYKNIGDGSQPLCILSVSFVNSDPNGEVFINLFSEKDFSINTLKEYAESVREKAEFDCKVMELLNEMISPNFKEVLHSLSVEYFTNKGISRDVITESLNRLIIDINLPSENKYSQVLETVEKKVKYDFPRRRLGGNQGTAQRYAYDLVKAIIDKHPSYNFNQLFALFGYKKNYIERLSDVKVSKRWCVSADDIITLFDGTKIVISNQWGFNNTSKPRMDRLREIARKYDIDDTLPF